MKKQNRNILTGQNKNMKHKGSILAYSLIILAAMIAIVSVVSVSSVIERKSADATQVSVQTIQIADSVLQNVMRMRNEGIKAPYNEGIIYNAITDTDLEYYNYFQCRTDPITGVNFLRNTANLIPNIPNGATYDIYFWGDDIDNPGNTNLINLLCSDNLDIFLTGSQYLGDPTRALFNIKRIKVLARYKNSVRTISIDL
jgi:hypothetical protein